MANNSLLSEEQIKQFAEIAEKCGRVRKVLMMGTTTLTPLNYEEEKEEFFKSKKYNPVFHYRHTELSKLSSIILHLEKKLLKLNLPDDIKEHMENYIDMLMLLFKTKSSVGTYDFSDNFEKLLKWNKYKHLKTPPTARVTPRSTEKGGKLYGATDIRHEFQKVLEKRYKIHSFDVIIDKFSTNIISAGYKKVSIGSKVKRNRNNVKRLVVHEIESHALQTFNSIGAPMYASLADYAESILNAEGLAVYNEIKSGTITKNALQAYKLRFESAKMLHKSFREIYNFLSEYMNPEKAYTATFRTKRGIQNTALPGGNPKDAVYLLGYHLIKDSMKSHEFRKDIYRTKSLSLTKLLKKYGLLENEPIIPTFLRK